MDPALFFWETLQFGKDGGSRLEIKKIRSSKDADRL